MRFLKDLNCENKRVIVRVGLNVPSEGNRIANDFRIKAVLPTIERLAQQKAKVILISHLGRPHGLVREKYSLRKIGEHLSGLLNQQVVFMNDCMGTDIKNALKKLKVGQVALLENLRFHEGEEKNDPDFAKQLAALGDAYVNDAFSASHRAHASIVSIPQYLPGYAGLLLEKEIEMLSKVLDEPARPLVAIIGGVKVSTKMLVIKSFLEKADSVVLGGALANMIIRAKGFAIGKSVVEEGMTEEVKKLKLTNVKMHIPVDIVVSSDPSGRMPIHTSPVGKIGDEEMILDIGPDTITLFKRIISQAKTIVWNGPMGAFEVDKFAKGSQETAEAIAANDGFSVAGGGETIACLAQYSVLQKINHVSTGGGAMLKFLAQGSLPGIEALEN